MTDNTTMTTEYRVEFQITRRRAGEPDFTEIGFGSSGAWHSLEQAAHIAQSAIQNGEYTGVRDVGHERRSAT